MNSKRSILIAVVFLLTIFFATSTYITAQGPSNCPPDEAIRMLQELTIAPVLKGFRGFDLDCHKLANIISKMGELAEELGPYFHQIDINPIVFSDDQWIALNAQLTLSK